MTMTYENLFKLQCLIKTTEIQHSVQCKLEKQLFFALATNNSDIILYLKKQHSYPSVIKRIPWFQGSHKQIAAFCFDPCGSWLLCVTLDDSLYIIPALALIDEENYTGDNRWKTNDITYIPFINLQLSHFRPTAITWWKDKKTSIDIAIIGTECGSIVLINLLNGQQIGIAHINENVNNLHVCENINNEGASLLITSKSQHQWRLLLEQYTHNLLHNPENEELYDNTVIHDNMETSVPSKSRLQELKQLSVGKLAVLKQKLIDTKTQALGENLCHDVTSKESNNDILTNSEISEYKLDYIKPEQISKNTFLSAQYDRKDEQLYTCYHSATNHITVHSPNLTVAPLSIHKVFESFKSILLAYRFFFVTDTSQHIVYIISNQLSEIHINGDSEFNTDSIVGYFSFKNNKEIVRAIYKISNFNYVPRKLSQESDTKHIPSKKIKDIKIELPILDTCIIVTNHCVYEVVLRKSLLSVFMELALKRNELEKAGKLAMIFGLNGQHLLEYAGDMFLSNKEFSRAVASYKLSKCKLLKSVLKFASVGHTSELLNYLTHCLLTPVIIEMPVATRIHLSNLCILAFIEMTLRVSSEQSKAIYKEFLYFLSTNTFYDELLAINMAGQTYLWEVLHHLATQRNLYSQMLDILMKTIQPFGANDFHPKSYGLLICLSEPGLLQAMLINHDLARSHMSFVHNNLPDSQIFVLQRLVTLYDPTNPILRSKLAQCKMHRTSTSHNLRSSQYDSIDSIDNIDQSDTFVEEIIETFILVLLTLIYKKRILNPNYKSTFFYKTQLLETNKELSEMVYHTDFKKRSLSAGFSHVALIRNTDVYTWGSSTQGCLGTGSCVLRYGTPHAVSFFQSMKLEVFSISCGHSHTLAVTNNGIYAWGASQFGQLGLGKVLQCSNPELINSLAQEIIIDAVAGQYHSIALTADGRVFTWGWGVYGQLGHGNTDEKTIPTLITSLLGIVVCYISAGYAHTLVLSVDGIVYAFGCNVFGQLGIGNNIKSSTPVKVLLPDGITLINTGYFHNLAVNKTNKLYIWGASPQVLRLQAQAQKKIRILEQDANEKKRKLLEDSEKKPDNTMNINEERKNLLENNVQTMCAQAERITPNINMQRKSSENADLKNLDNEDGQTHLTPSAIDTSLVKGQITQISAGCHHNALITKDGSLYTWGRNLDGQIGNGTRREVPIPTPLYYNPACMFTQILRRHNDFKKMRDQEDLDNNTNSNNSLANDENILEDNGNAANTSRSTHIENIGVNKERINSVINTIGIACGYDYTIVIQPGGTVLAWGNNNRAQLGRIPAKDVRDADDKLVLLKSSKRVVRVPHASHIALDIPSQVPGIPTPTISYQSHDIFSLAGYIRPLSVIEKSPGELTLHYVLEHFHHLYHSSKIMTKCIELENYQACSKIAALDHDILTAFEYQLKVLDILSIQSSSNYLMTETPCEIIESNSSNKIISRTVDLKNASSFRNIKKNTELFNRQAKKNLMESLEDSVAKSSMKISTSRSLNNLQVLTQELYSFNCEGGLEELCKNKKNNVSSNSTMDYFDAKSDINEDEQQERLENHIFDENDPLLQHENIVHNSTQKIARSSDCMKILLNVKDNCSDQYDTHEEKTVSSDKVFSRFQNNYMINETIKTLKFYLSSITDETNILKCELLQNIIDFWIDHNLPMQSLENVFLEYIHIIYYPLGLLLFCQNMIGKYINANKFDTRDRSFNPIDLFSIRFCLQILSRLSQHIDQDIVMPEYIQILSSLIANHYGASLNIYPSSSGNSISEQIMEEIISTAYSEMEDSRLFAHIKDPNAVHRFLSTEEDKIVFTCGHHFPLSAYKTNVIPAMETKLISPSLILPCTSQYLGNMLSHTFEPEILCPLCTVDALKAIVEKIYI